MSINKMINALVEKDINDLQKMKKEQLLSFCKSLLTDYYYELDNNTIMEYYNER